MQTGRWKQKGKEDVAPAWQTSGGPTQQARMRRSDCHGLVFFFSFWSLPTSQQPGQSPRRRRRWHGTHVAHPRACSCSQTGLDRSALVRIYRCVCMCVSRRWRCRSIGAVSCVCACAARWIEGWMGAVTCRSVARHTALGCVEQSQRPRDPTCRGCQPTGAACPWPMGHCKCRRQAGNLCSLDERLSGRPRPLVTRCTCIHLLCICRQTTGGAHWAPTGCHGGQRHGPSSPLIH